MTTFKEVLSLAQEVGLCGQCERIALSHLPTSYYEPNEGLIIVKAAQAQEVANLLGLTFLEALWGIFLHELGHACDSEFLFFPEEQEDLFRKQIFLIEVVAWEYARQLLPFSPLGEK